VSDEIAITANNHAPERTRLSVLELDCAAAQAFFLKEESYCNLDLPPYIRFDALIDGVHKELNGKKLSSLSSGPRDHDDVNYTILHNKDGKYAWRPFQLINPALYVSLVHHLTEEAAWQLVRDRFKAFATNSKISCLSLPVISLTEEKDKAGQINHWWHAVEQHSIELSLDYQYLFETDITDCYGSIYTHSIAWALHTKPTAKDKENRNDKTLLGNQIDSHIQDMRYGQTNGIPQGSVLMDFIAEMVLGLADLELSEKIEAAGIEKYRILRYRDDYRIFVHNPQEGECIIKFLTEVTIGLGLKLNPGKTKASSEVVRASIKSDKLAWMCRKQSERSLQKHLFIIHDHAHAHPNAGSLAVALVDFHKRLSRQKKLLKQVMPLIAIVADIAYRNPRTYAVCAVIIGKLLSYLESTGEKLAVTEKIKARFEQIPNTGHLQIWIQRLTHPLSQEIAYEEPICKLVAGGTVALWNCKWINDKKLKKAISQADIIDLEKLAGMEPVPPVSEIELFLSKALYGGSA
jgi:RNA-directed DNA polymerase